jgi:hypothetical protein
VQRFQPAKLRGKAALLVVDDRHHLALELAEAMSLPPMDLASKS